MARPPLFPYDHVYPSVITTASADRLAAQTAFAEWAEHQAGAPRDVASLVQDVETSHDHVGVMSTEVLGRRAVWKSVSADSRSRVTVPSIAMSNVDPWTAQPAALREESDHVAICDTCAGEKKVQCAACRGVGKTICHACSGQRKMYGYAANGSRRLLNCTTCRGKGELDCAHCRRGIASCPTCGGEGRLQRWIELESWRRALTTVHPHALARQLGWSESPTDRQIAGDIEVVVDLDKPHRLAPADLGGVPANWLQYLSPVLQPGERVSRQHLRIARLTTHTVRYRLGGGEDRVSFSGRRLVPVPPDGLTAFARRASNLRSLRWLLLVLVAIAALVSLGRGAFYWSIPTLLSLAAFSASMVMVYAAVAEWMGIRRRTGACVVAAAFLLVLAAALTFAARPRLDHAERLIAAGRLDAAEAELRALQAEMAGRIWPSLYLARIRRIDDIAAARAMLEKIPRGLPQYREATAVIDRLLLRSAAEDARHRRWLEVAAALAQLSPDARRQPESTAAGDGVRAAALEMAREAEGESDVRRRLGLRLGAEKLFVAWERASGNWGTPPLIALRTAMARDVEILERPARRRRSR